MAKPRAAALSLAGERLEVEVGPKSTVTELKLAITAAWSIPTSVLRLVLGTEAVSDDDPLLPESYHVLVSLDVLRKELGSKASARRKHALDELRALGLKGGPDAIAEATICLQDNKSIVREAAVQVLAAAFARGDPRGLDTLGAALQDRNWSVRRAATQAVGALGRQGEARALEVLGRQLTDWSASVRLAAVDALVTLTGQDDQSMMTPLCECCLDDDSEVRLASVRALTRLAEMDRDRVAKVLCDVLAKDDDLHVRLAALRSLAQFTSDGNSCSIPALSACLEDEDPAVRRAAELALTKQLA
mmetsp:Transcript_102259/g.305309  ORF Transcript_102259/g.305309 Transcript_102259/m.305309 type:complete len:303 (-) Transcript_102259:40-948(-)